ncbi:uncharacterized protein LOC120426613 [Culex pipiens pallens]|uniref:uncharacterized protein LOC120426613 n=1 Tax=Culex pipiens pallens TaxID=42434 RepID=UPI0019548F46|nr:uncharacterized protein LOC120426613 [Culex pipiens pallens]XP_052561985.1 uncharacterized protein LOC120426613 [Culex pipiens pallens]
MKRSLSADINSGRLTIAWYRNRPSPTTPGWLKSWARTISTMLGYKSDGRVEVNVVHKALAIGGDSARGKRTGLLGDPWGGNRDHLVERSHRCSQQMAFFTI